MFKGQASRVLIASILVFSFSAETLRAAGFAPAPASDENKARTASETLVQGIRLLRGLEADKAHTQLLEALRLYTELKDPLGTSAARAALGDVYAQSALYDRALENYRAAAEGFRAAGDVQNADAVFAKMGERYLQLGDFEQARAAYASMTGASPERAAKESGLSSEGGGAAGALAGIATCLAPLAPAQQDPRNPPNQGRAPRTPSGVGRMDLRIQDERGNPVKNVRAQVQSTRPGGLYCECWNTTDQFGRAVMPPLHIADKIKLVLRPASGPTQELLLSAQQLSEPVNVVFSQGKASLLQQQARAVVANPAIPCFDFYRAFAAYATSELGTARAELYSGKPAGARTRYEKLLEQLNLPGIEKFKRVASFRAAAMTALGDISLGEGKYDEALGLYTEAAEGARKEGRADLMWAAQRGMGRASWKKSQAVAAGHKISEMPRITTVSYRHASAPQQSARLRGEAMASYLAAVRTIETLRAGSLRADEARTNFLAGFRDVYDEAIAVVTEMALIASGTNAARSTEAVVIGSSSQELAAIAVSLLEQSRSRSLLDLLGESAVGIRGGVAPELLARRNEVRARQQEIARLLTGVVPPDGAPVPPVAELERELDHLSYTYDALENQIRSSSPRYDSLAGGKPLSLSEIRQRVVDEKTALLYYNLGEEISYLWVIQRDGVAVARLPGHDAVEQQIVALRAQMIPAGLRRSIVELRGGQATPRETERQPTGPANYARAAFALYNTILRPASTLIAGKRLLIIPDGALSFVPFEALVSEENPAPEGYGSLRYLIKDVEVAYAPSASVLAAVREQSARSGAGAGQGNLLIVADPVFNASDERVSRTASARPSAGGDGTRGLTVVKALDDAAGGSSGASNKGEIARLESTRAEAEEIARLARTMNRNADVLLDTTASETSIVERDLRRYSVIHFATHGLLNTRYPEFTGLILSLVGESREDGFLRVNEVFDLSLGSPLVMLSACDTGLGRERRGEGIIGLTRAFMYAGAPTVGVSLWAVADKSTSRLMMDFYDGFLSQGLRPAGAMRRAQLKMIESSDAAAPFFWAPFIIVGG